MPIRIAIILFLAGVLGGVLNAVAGGGSFVLFPALWRTGVPPVPANATNTVALWVGVTASGGAYRNRLNISRRVMVPLIVTSVVGGLAGAFLLLKTPAHTFMKVLPWLMFGATLLFAFGKKLTGRFSGGLSHEATSTALFIACIVELVVSVYGGYFGGGVGIMNLAMLAALGMTDIHAMNALKSVLGSVINGVAASPGTVTAKAKVVRSLAEASKLQAGDVLVCEMTLPPWTPAARDGRDRHRALSGWPWRDRRSR